MKKLNISKHTFLILIFVSAVMTAQTNNEDPDTTKPVQYRRGIPLQEGYQSYEEKYSGKNLEEIKRSLFPLRSSGVWTELNPKVPRVDYLGIYFVDTLKGWAVGSLGTIIYSTSSGKKWSTAESPVNNVLLYVHSYNGQTVVASGYNGTIVRSTDGGVNWTQVSSGVTGDLWEIKMIDDTLGWACGAGPSLLRTTDGAITWETINTGFNSFHYWALDFIDKNILYVAGNGGNLLKTTNGGSSWELMQTGFGKHLYKIKVFNQQRIITGGEMGWIAYSNNGGAVWDTSKAGGIIDAMTFLNETVGYVTGNLSPNFIYKTTDGGESWIPQHVIEIGNYCLSFVNETTGFSSGLGLSIQKTTNGGESWEKSILNDNFYDVHFIDENTGYIVSGSLYKTTDGGENWEKQTGAGGYSIKFINSLTGFIGNNNGSIVKTTNGGESWYSSISDPTAGQITKFIFWSDSVGWALGSKVLKTIDRGETWVVKGSGGTSIFFIDTLVGWISRVNGRPYKTTDGGNTWIEQTNLNLFQTLDIYFLDSLNGFILESNKLYYTNNSGINWLQISGVTGFSVAAKFSYYNDSIIFITGYTIYRSLNGGESWNQNNELNGIRVSQLNLLNGGLGYVSGEVGTIFKYQDDNVPVELISFYGELNDDIVTLNWATATETNNLGFYIEKKEEQKKEWEKIGFTSGVGNSTTINYYSYNDSLAKSGRYSYRLKQIDYDGKYSYSYKISIFYNSIISYKLNQNYPNPFNSSTIITYQVPKKSFINISVYNIIGEKVSQLVNEDKEEGIYKEVFFCKNLPTGIYLIRMKTSTGFNAINKIILIK
jgi:photosystem II stability/assembly factor-like uncharacterized protein